MYRLAKYGLWCLSAWLTAQFASAVSWNPACDGTVVREIADPATGHRWLLVRDPEHPGGPGRMVLAGQFYVQSPAKKVSHPQPVIRGGDAVVVEEHTEVSDLRLEGKALGSALPGASLRVRLKFNGGVVRTVAIGAGRAALANDLGAMR